MCEVSQQRIALYQGWKKLETSVSTTRLTHVSLRNRGKLIPHREDV